MSQLVKGSRVAQREAQKAAKKEAKRRKRRKLFLRIHKTFVTLAVLIILGTFAWRFYIPIPEMTATPPVATSTSTLGATSHYVRKDGFYNFLLLGSDDGHGNADTIIVVGLDTRNKSLNLISVPRDTLVYREWSSFPKLNSAMSKGVDKITEEVSYTLGIPIDFYLSIGLDAFVAVVDLLGGVDFDVPETMYHDDDAGFIINLQQGNQWLDGAKTLQLVRYRGYATADIGRTQTQQAVLKLLIQKMVSWKNLTNYQEFIHIFQTYVDTNLETTHFLWFAKSLMSTVNLEVYSQTLEGRGDGVYNSYRWCYELDREKTLSTVNSYINPYTEDRTLEDMHLISANNYNS